MCGSDTLTTVVSSTSMNVLVITAMATSHGFTSFHARAELRSKVCVAVAIFDESYKMREQSEWTRIAEEVKCRCAPRHANVVLRVRLGTCMVKQNADYPFGLSSKAAEFMQ